VAKGGLCLSNVYEGLHAKYRFRCSQGHEWEASPAKVVSGGQWCRRCSHRQRVITRNSHPDTRYAKPERLAELQAFAASKGGVCLSREYRGLRRRYRFRCDKGHEWEALGGNILMRGNWCKKCNDAPRGIGIDAMRAVAQARGGDCLSETYANNRHKLIWKCHRGRTWHAIPGNILRGHWCPNCKFLGLTKDPNRRLKFE
jgi:hypothetical protein